MLENMLFILHIRDMIVYGIVVPVLPLIVNERLGRDPKSIGFLFGCYGN